MPNLTLDDAARFLSDSWDSVSGSTIRHCWQHAGIVPPDYVEEMKLLDQSEAAGTEDVMKEIQEQIADLRKKRKEDIGDPASATEYVEFDNKEACTATH